MGLPAFPFAYGEPRFGVNVSADRSDPVICLLSS